MKALTVVKNTLIELFWIGLIATAITAWFFLGWALADWVRHRGLGP